MALLFYLFLDEYLWQGVFFGNELHRDRIHAVACILFREEFAGKDMTKVTFAERTDNFRSAAIFIRHTIHGAGDLIIKTGPAASG